MEDVRNITATGLGGCCIGKINSTQIQLRDTIRGTIDVRCLKNLGVRPGVGKGTPKIYAARPINLKNNFSVQLSHGSDLANEKYGPNETQRGWRLRGKRGPRKRQLGSARIGPTGPNMAAANREANRFVPLPRPKLLLANGVVVCQILCNTGNTGNTVGMDQDLVGTNFDLGGLCTGILFEGKSCIQSKCMTLSQPLGYKKNELKSRKHSKNTLMNNPCRLQKKIGLCACREKKHSE